MVPAENKTKRLSSVNHTTKTVHHPHHQPLTTFRKCSFLYVWQGSEYASGALVKIMSKSSLVFFVGV